ncbi:MAG: hypothetical protein EXS64_19710 [Candidatus Latescibacteria bacterium]|nr:hypothetical protein [Candidatus Latescibacterota bacterium]
MRFPSITHEKAALLSTTAVMLLFGILAWRPWDWGPGQGDAWMAVAIYVASVLALGGMLDHLYKRKG